MPRDNAMATPEAIRIEDEVWQEAFTRREPARSGRERRLRAVDVELPDWLVEATGKTMAEAASWSVPRAATRERATSGRAAAAAVPLEPPAITALEPPRLVSAPAPLFADAPLAAPTPAPGRAASAVEPSVGVTPTRRTVKIQGRGAERNLPLPDSSRRRPQRRAYERTGFRPDRLAMWAVMLGFLLVLIAIVSAH